MDTNLKANRGLEDVGNELSAEYVKPTDLEGHKVNIVDAYTRTGQFGDECCFEVQYIEGEFAGASAIVTLKESPMRKKLVRAVQKHGSLGPVKLAQVGKEIKGNKPWGFVSANEHAKPQPELNMAFEPAADEESNEQLPF
jgi:hypothetical protein